ncbi:unnamed protein product, partial [Polarella glacialis]
KPDVISWNSAIAACASAHPRAGPEAEKMFRELVASGLVPDGILLTTLARAVGPERRRLLCEEMESKWLESKGTKQVVVVVV